MATESNTGIVVGARQTTRDIENITARGDSYSRFRRQANIRAQVKNLEVDVQLIVLNLADYEKEITRCT